MADFPEDDGAIIEQPFPLPGLLSATFTFVANFPPG
jgi:hypothetical protein